MYEHQLLFEISTHHISYHLLILYIDCIKYQLFNKHKTNKTRIVQ